jgi:ADP-ribose pyrophosphatase
VKILSTDALYRGMKGTKVFMTLFRRVFENKEQEHSYFFVSRQREPSKLEDKLPDAVVIVAFSDNGTRIVLTKEFRVPIGGFEYGFSAGLIEEKDYTGAENIQEAAKRAAIREFKEETGMEFTPIEASADNLYSTAGLSNESICVVMGLASGKPSGEFLEGTEQIETLQLTREELILFMADTQKLAHSKIAWPMMWCFARLGFPKLVDESVQNL